ncbi:MAG: hypothetical protein L6437_01055, partial [Kiritimatiellae bacterium]|nr:hypothetical protein [Kiritimatiellia bacterium]
MNAIRRVLLVACLLLCMGIVSYAETETPVEAFVAQFKGDLGDDETLMMFCLDLNGDGKEEVFLSREKDRNGRAGNIWDVYISCSNKFLPCDQLVTLDHRDLIRKKTATTGQYRLFSVTSPQKPQLLLTEFLVSKTAITQKKIAKIELLSWADSSDATIDLLKDTDQGVVQITKGKARDLKKIMKKIRAEK